MRAIFLDRDGVICKNRSDHVKSWQEFEFLPGAKQSIAQLSRLPFPIIVVTNQAVIGRGMVSADVIEGIHHRMLNEITAYGGRIDYILTCPHRPEDKCECRKPAPGMLLEAARKFDIDLPESYLVGDAATDILAAQRARSQAIMVLTGRGKQQLVQAFRTAKAPFIITHNLASATSQIINKELQHLMTLEKFGQLPINTAGAIAPAMIR
jgi:D-glycero-D-manno-heptose 1,7-bisphosphate phosphatase